MLKDQLVVLGVETPYVEPSSPWENGCDERFKGRLQDQIVVRESFDTLHGAQFLIGNWREHYNQIRPHSALRYISPWRTCFGATPVLRFKGLIQGMGRNSRCGDIGN